MKSDVQDWDEERLPVKAVLTDLADVLDEIEKGRGTLAFKYHMARRVLKGRTFPSGITPFQDFADLCKLRNLLVHLRPGDTLDEEGHIVPAEKVIVGFQQRGLAHRRPAGDRTPGTTGMSWLNDLQTAEMAAWAYTTACTIINAVIEMLPETEPPLPSVTWLRESIKCHLS